MKRLIKKVLIYIADRQAQKQLRKRLEHNWQQHELIIRDLR